MKVSKILAFFLIAVIGSSYLHGRMHSVLDKTKIQDVCGRLSTEGYTEEAHILQTAGYIRTIIDQPADRFAEGVPPVIFKNRLVQAWLFGAPRSRDRKEVGRFESAMRKQYRSPSAMLLMWLHNQGIPVVANGDYLAIDQALIMDPFWIPALKERVAQTNKYISGSMVMIRLGATVPSGSDDLAIALGVLNDEKKIQRKSINEKLESLSAYWMSQKENVTEFPVNWHTFEAVKSYHQGAFNEAVDRCEHLKNGEYSQFSWMLDRIWIDSLWRSGRHKEAWRLLNSLTDKSASKTLLLLKAEYALHDGDIKEAKESLGFLAQYPENPAGQMLRARVAAAEGDVAEWLDAAIQTLFYSYGWEEDFFGQALAAGDLAIKRAKKR